MKNGLNIAGLIVGLALVLVSLPSTLPGLLGLAAGLALAGVNIYALLVKRKAARKAAQQGEGHDAQ